MSAPAREKDYWVTVCAACKKAYCWHCEFVCEDYKTAGTKTMLASELDAIGLEHPSNYSVETIEKITGQPPEAA